MHILQNMSHVAETCLHPHPPVMNVDVVPVLVVCDNSRKPQTRFHRQRRWELTEQLSTPLRTKNKLLKYWTKIWSSDKGSGEKTHFAEKQIDAPKACLSPADVHKQRTKARLPKDPTDLTSLTLLFFFFYSAHLCIVHRGTFLEIGAYYKCVLCTRRH